MGLLDKFWDDNLAGPRPETGLARLRKQYASFSPRSPAAAAAGAKDEAAAIGGGGSLGSSGGGGDPDVEPRVTRSIMIKVPPGWSSPANGTPPSSPAGSTPPISPFSGGRRWNNRLRKSTSESYDRGEEAGAMHASTSSVSPFDTLI